MFIDQLGWRVQTTLALSLLAHVGLLSLFGSGRFAQRPERLVLTEVEYQEEAAPPTEMEKLMRQLAPASARPAAGRQAAARAAAKAEIEQTSFREVVGMKAGTSLDQVTEADLTRLAALPKAMAPAGPAPAGALSTPPKIALVPSPRSAASELAEQVVPLNDLPPVDWGPGISRRGFQAPEAIIKQVKAARGQQAQPPQAKKLSLRRDAFITGEVEGRELLHREYPEIPRWLEEKGVEAEVVLRFVVNPDGEVGDRIIVQKTSGYAELDRLAVAALKKFIFAPLPLTVKQAEQSGTIAIRFTLK